MSQIKSASNHYLSLSGKAYFERNTALKFEFGRVIQAEYFLPYTSDDKVLLDFGCADGLFLRLLPAKERIGIEVNPAAREKCKLLSERDNITIEIHDAFRTVPDNRIDVLISNHTIEHVLTPYETFLEIRRVLNISGCLIIVVPFDDWRQTNHRCWKRNDPDNHLYTWSPLNLGNLLTEAGFKVVKTEVHSRAWSPKFFWFNRFFGRKSFDMACYFLSLLKNRREILCVALPS